MHEDRAGAYNAVTRFAQLAALLAAVFYLPPDKLDPTKYLTDPGTRMRFIVMLKYFSFPKMWGVIFNKYIENYPTIDQSALSN